MIRMLSLALLLSACGGKKAPASSAEPVPEPAAPSAAPAPAPKVEAEPEPAPPPKPEVKASNADFEVAVTFGDGSGRRGRVRRVERGSDWYAEDGWTDNEYKVMLSLEKGDQAKDVPWSEVKSLEVEYLGRGAIGCTYDSTYTPIMYTCTMKTATTVTLKDGSAWDMTTRHKWRFELADGNTIEFYGYKLPARAQESGEAEIGDGSTQNFALYEQLQDELVEMVKTDQVVKRITVQ